MTNKEIVQGLYAAFSTGNIPAVLAVLDEGIVWTEAEGFLYGGTYYGPNAVLANVFMKLGSEWEDFTVHPHQLVADGDTVVSLGEYTGTYKATSRPMRVPVVHVWKIKDGKVIQFDQHTDTKVLAEQIGTDR